MLVLLDDKGKGRDSRDDKWEDPKYVKSLSRWTGAELKLNSAKVGDSGVPAVIRKIEETGGKLTKLELRNDCISNVGFQSIADFIVSPTAIHLTSLNLFGNEAGEKGARFALLQLHSITIDSENYFQLGALQDHWKEIQASCT